MSSFPTQNHESNGGGGVGEKRTIEIGSSLPLERMWKENVTIDQQVGSVAQHERKRHELAGIACNNGAHSVT